MEEEIYELDLNNISTEEQVKMWLEYRRYGIELIFSEEDNKKAEHN